MSTPKSHFIPHEKNTVFLVGDFVDPDSTMRYLPLNRNVGNTFRYTREIDSQTPKMTRHIFLEARDTCSKAHHFLVSILVKLRGLWMSFPTISTNKTFLLSIILVV